MKQAAERITEQSNGFDSRESFDISSWLLEADQIDRTVPTQPVEQETRQFTMEDTTKMESSVLSEEAKVEEPKSKRPEKKEPMKLPKGNEGPSTKNTKDAATETLKKYFGGR